MRAALVVLLACLFAVPAHSFGTIGGGIGRIFIYGDSHNNGYGETPKPDGVELAPIATALGIPSSHLWVMAEGGVSVYEHVLNSDEGKCDPDSVNTDSFGSGAYKLRRCRVGVHQVKRVGGACRSFAPLLPSALAEDEAEVDQCTGDREPIEACTGSGTGDMRPTCLADLPISGQDYFVMMFGTNDVYNSRNASWCTQSQFDPNFKRDYEAMIDEFELYGMTGVISTPPPNLEQIAADDETNEKIEDCITTFIMTTMKAAHPNHVYVDTYARMRDYQTQYGDEAFSDLYVNCDTPFPCADGDDGIHLSKAGDAFFASGIAEGIRELQRRRLALVSSSSEVASATPGTRCDADSDCTTMAWESLDVLDNSGSNLTSPHNPSNTTSDTAFSWNTGAGYSDAKFIAISSSNAPALTGRTYALEFSTGYGIDTYSGTTADADYSVDATGCERLCFISYQYLWDDAVNGNAWQTGDRPNCGVSEGGDPRHKMDTYNWGPAETSDQWQLEGGNPNPCDVGTMGSNNSFGVAFSGSSGDTPLDIDVMRATWVRLETCVETTADDLEATSGTLTAQVRTTRIDTGAQTSTTWGSMTATQSLTQARPNQTHSYPDAANEENRYIAGFGQFCYASEGTSKWPGPDCNIETGSSDC